MIKSCDVHFLYFHNCSNLNLGAPVTYYQEWNNIGIRLMMLQIRPSIEKNIFLLLLWCHCLRKSINFYDSNYIISYQQPRSATVFYKAPFTFIDCKQTSPKEGQAMQIELSK